MNVKKNKNTKKIFLCEMPNIFLLMKVNKYTRTQS